MPEPKKVEMPSFLDPIMWSIIGITCFCLLVGTGLHAAGFDNEGFQKWSDNILGVGFLLGIGFIGGAFKGFFSAMGYWKEKG